MWVHTLVCWAAVGSCQGATHACPHQPTCVRGRRLPSLCALSKVASLLPILAPAWITFFVL